MMTRAVIPPCSSDSGDTQRAAKPGYHTEQVVIPAKPENKHPRKGKTRYDHEGGSHARHLGNIQLRRDWNRTYQNNAKNGSTATLKYPEIGG